MRSVCSNGITSGHHRHVGRRRRIGIVHIRGEFDGVGWGNPSLGSVWIWRCDGCRCRSIRLSLSLRKRSTGGGGLLLRRVGRRRQGAAGGAKPWLSSKRAVENSEIAELLPFQRISVFWHRHQEQFDGLLGAIELPCSDGLFCLRLQNDVQWLIKHVFPSWLPPHFVLLVPSNGASPPDHDFTARLAFERLECRASWSQEPAYKVVLWVLFCRDWDLNAFLDDRPAWHGLGAWPHTHTG
mmetsp:Transcript_18294/g.31690  ORF Transcript_18294/g.31690 Transcript_18294/m.31690 type:complete len:239 (+) Transcript_18294:244-960(+)